MYMVAVCKIPCSGAALLNVDDAQSLRAVMTCLLLDKMILSPGGVAHHLPIGENRCCHKTSVLPSIGAKRAKRAITGSNQHPSHAAGEKWSHDMNSLKGSRLKMHWLNFLLVNLRISGLSLRHDRVIPPTAHTPTVL